MKMIVGAILFMFMIGCSNSIQSPLNNDSNLTKSYESTDVVLTFYTSGIQTLKYFKELNTYYSYNLRIFKNNNKQIHTQVPNEPYHTDEVHINDTLKVYYYKVINHDFGYAGNWYEIKNDSLIVCVHTNIATYDIEMLKYHLQYRTMPD